ncbi:antibiotic biosynthesis monooxygenase family protein [Microbulbifer hainanensis]|uniref:antibiotic biosynthesis monooxygenase family protein n=1 Tax=Microbulbifer hainanensis TaxID=2735675 RepID=UPI0018696129|nr:antibiotic biosynthesis monooxygenase family protein [Microbulbifer hainanensis]
MNDTQTPNTRVYRLDRFVVPTAAHDEFIRRVQETHSLLREQPGFVQDFLLESPRDSGSFTLATLVEWRDQQAIEAARTKVAEQHRISGFNAQALMAKLGIQAELGNYKSL